MPIRSNKYIPNEEIIHEGIAKWMHQNVACVWFHVPNGEKRDAATAAKLKRMGVRAGVADIIVLHEGRFIAIEVKRQGGVQSPNQKGFGEAVARSGGFYHLAYCLQDVINILKEAGVVPPDATFASCRPRSPQHPEGGQEPTRAGGA